MAWEEALILKSQLYYRRFREPEAIEYFQVGLRILENKGFRMLFDMWGKIKQNHFRWFAKIGYIMPLSRKL